ncbi:MAG TPA: SprB repeat-containing protein [Puia sp.]|nr:SprB repeat-containing protein [Puia sp.]
MKIHKFLQRSIPYVFFCHLLTIVCVYTAKAQCPASLPLVINSVTPTASRCQASGTATVSVSGGATPYTYSIIAGPSTAPAQSSNVFSSLAPGVYTIQVTDNCNTSVTGTVTVTGNYTIPSPTATTQTTSCPNSNDGSLTINVTGGLGSFSYSLINPSPVTAGPQASNVFTGIPTGTYTYQVSDSCGNFQTRTATVAAGSGGNISPGIFLQYVACDSFEAKLTIYVNQLRPPYTATFTLPDGRAWTYVLSASDLSSGYAEIDVYFRYHHVTGVSDPMNFSVNDNCGTYSHYQLLMSTVLDMNEMRYDPVGCGSGYTYTFDPVGEGHCSTITYTLISRAGNTLAVQTNNSTFGGYPPGKGYKVIRQDCCEKDSLTFTWDPPPSYSSITPLLANPFVTCKENTTSEYFMVTANFTQSIVLASGPPSMTFLDGTVYTYTYPDTIQDPNLGINVVYLSGLTAGTYKVYDLDICGGKDSTTFTISPSNLRQATLTAKGEVACGGGGSIVLNTTSNAPYAAISISPSGTTVYTIQSPSVNTVTGLTPGTYYLTYQFSDFVQNLLPIIYPTGFPTAACDVLMDTVVVPSYVQPSFSTTPAVANCGATRDVALLPDSASGVQPYQYQITAGPETTTAQSSPVFTGLAAGTYTFLMSDACGNSYSSNISIDTLSVPAVTTTGGNCAGGAATFTLPVTPFNSYTWRHPDGTITTGDTLAFNPITGADTGTYTITATSTIGGCTSTSSKTLTLGFCTVLQETLLHFSGQQKDDNIQLSWQMADQAGISYYIVERSTDGVTFASVQEVMATNAAQANYTAIDTHIPSGVVYYRLQMVGNNGVINYSQAVLFNMDNSSSFSVAPTLITGNTPVKCTYPGASSNGIIRVVGVDGRVYRTITAAAGSTATSIDLTGLARGDYFVVFTRNDTMVPTQVWKE